MSEDKEPWFILGAGAIGCLWATAFIEAKQNCILLIKPKSVKKYASPVIKIEHKGTVTSIPIKKIPTNNINVKIKKLLISLKAPTAIDAINSILYALDANAKVVIILNGVKIQDKIIAKLKTKNIWLGSSSDGVWTKKPLNIHHVGNGITWVGSYYNQIKKEKLPFAFLPRVQPIASIDIKTKIWIKAAINSIINPLTVRYLCKNGKLLINTQINKRVKALVVESEQVLKAQSINLDNNLFSLVKSVISATAENYSSTYQDFMAKRKTELPWINGIFIEFAQKFNLNCNEHKLLAQELKSLHSINIIHETNNEQSNRNRNI